MANRYLDYIAALAPPSAARVSNKMPANFQHLGLIALLFPEARIVRCVRDPLNTCLSCYFQQFAEGQFFAYDLEGLGGYCLQYRRLMEHWREVLDVAMLEISYEELVGDQERVSRKMVAHCGLNGMSAACAFTRRVGRSPRPVTTRSASPCTAARWDAGAITNAISNRCAGP